MEASPSAMSGDPIASAARLRVYQVWPGRNKFLLGGRLVLGPDAINLLPTLFLIIAPIVVYYVFVGRHLLNDFPNHGGIAILVMVGVHTCAVLALLMLTSLRDPGIIPRSNRPPTIEDAGLTAEDVKNMQGPIILPSTKQVTVDGATVVVKYCRTCQFYRPPRSSHCSVCDNCVDRFDHHCPWLGQCVGRRNYPFFFMFVLSSTFLCFFIFSMCALRIKILMNGDPPHTVQKALQRAPAAAFLMAYAFLSSWFVGGLTLFHLYLISHNKTTYENFRFRYDGLPNPYDKGIVRNFKEVLCSAIPPSKVDFRAFVQPQPPPEPPMELEVGRMPTTTHHEDISIKVEDYNWRQ